MAKDKSILMKALKNNPELIERLESLSAFDTENGQRVLDGMKVGLALAEYCLTEEMTLDDFIGRYANTIAVTESLIEAINRSQDG